jgi:hypothetical protein
MKKIIKYIIMGVLVAPIFTISSCKKDINDINKTNPNQFSDSDPKLMITGAQLANVMINEGEATRLACIFAGQFTGFDRQFISYGQYNMTAGDFDSPWSTLYADGIGQCRLIREKAITANDKVLEGVAMITEANLLLTASSLWGDIPNTQACNPNIKAPGFDKMAAVYNYCIALLDSSVSRVGTSSNYKAAYAGTFTWKEVANSLKARALLHKKDYAGAIVAATAGISLGNDFYAKHETNAAGAWNLYYDFTDWNRAGYISCDGSHIFALLDSASTKNKRNAKTDEKARFDYYFLLDNYTPVDPNMYGGIFDAVANFPLCSYNENQLILAECYARTSNDVKALESLNLVRAAHEAQFGPGAYADYLSTDPQVSDNAKLLKEILTEKYVSLFGQTEAFNDVRRTNNLIGVPINNGTKLPGRFLYPQSEINSNPSTPKGGTLFDAVDLFK